MLREQTLEKLRHMQLRGMAAALMAQSQDPEAQALSFEERLGLPLLPIRFVRFVARQGPLLLPIKCSDDEEHWVLLPPPREHLLGGEQLGFLLRSIKPGFFLERLVLRSRPRVF